MERGRRQAGEEREVRSLEDAVVVVVGGSSGMGLATAKRASLEGARVTVVGRDPDKLEAARQEVGGTARAHAGDVRDEEVVRSLFGDLERVDHVALFAGEQPRAAIADTDRELYQRALDARLWAAVTTCKHGSPKMPEDGSFTFCSGVSSQRARPERAVGAAATAALESFARGMAVELAPRRANAVCPGAVATPVLTRYFGEERDRAMEQFAARLPVGRIGQPEDVADAVLFLMGNPYVTGISLRVDGGALLLG